jgi:hypothetical protein
MPFPPDYIAALEALGRVFDLYRERTGVDAVLVGGAAAAIYTAGMFQSSDFDVVAAHDDAFVSAMLENGFLHEDREGHLLVGFYHPDHPQYGFQQVSGALFDGLSEPGRLVRVIVKTTEESAIVLPAIEDMIADRLGQHAVAPLSDDSRLRQARALLKLAEKPDIDYLIRRIWDEGGDPALLGLNLDRQA